MDDIFTLRHSLPVATSLFPSTRYQGSKRKMVSPLFHTFNGLPFSTVLDLYSGTGTVSLLLRTLGKSVHSNDILSFNTNASDLLQGSTEEFIRRKYHQVNLQHLIHEANVSQDAYVSNLYKGIYFRDEENIQIDRFCQNVKLYHPLERALYIYCVGQALLMKRPYNLSHRSNLAMRTRDVERSFGNAKTWETPIFEHASKILRGLEKFPFGPSVKDFIVTNFDADRVELFSDKYDVVYMDPPYLNENGLGVDYCDFYHFLEGLSDYSLFLMADKSYPHRPIVKGRSPWLSVKTALVHLQKVISKFKHSTIVLSYRQDGRPTIEELRSVFENCGRRLDGEVMQPYKYALSKSDDTKEYILISRPL